jgi:acetyl esterase/lipase
MRMRLPPRRWSFENSYGARRWNVQQVKVERDIVYTHTPQRTLMLDVYSPRLHPARGSRYPAVIVIHGGAWRYGDKGEVFTPHNHYLAGLGYVVYDIQYRLSHEARWPAALEDVQAAIRWVKRYAAAYQVDAERIALLGRSAGGHLALLAGYGQASGTEVAAVVAIYAPTDLRMWMSLPDNEVTRFLGGTTVQHPQAYAASSPLEHVRAGLPPTLLVQGYRDDLVAPPHTEMLANKLLATHNTVVTLRVPWARHGFDAFLSGLGSQMIQYDIDRFLAWRMYREDPDE